ncbi:MAG: PIG-L family deacetylase [Planctomycetaceae bacterium]|jgi:LmbE family N-acetylglucosaminyl deacetylase|nr:PIG-L family deacetylase [Planctomycetaceae bacterium]
MSEIVFDLRGADGTILSGSASVVFSDWRGDKECWLYVSPHDDDVVLGAGLTFVSGLALGIETHVIVSTIGAGYCRAEHRETIGQIRRGECCRSFEVLGLPASNLHFFDYRATDILSNVGRRFTSDLSCPTAIAGASGFQNSFTWLLRQVRPNRVFLPSQTDIHPAHKSVHEEFLISVFHARGKIWPELGDPITEFPKLYEYATYNDYIDPPTLRVRTSDDLLERKLLGIAAYVSQEQIELLVQTVRNMGAREYIHELIFKLFDPKQYDLLFDGEKENKK